MDDKNVVRAFRCRTTFFFDARLYFSRHFDRSESRERSGEISGDLSATLRLRSR